MNHEQRAVVLSRIADLGTPSRSYFLLLFLSTLIATYGLISNSTATVIGAMIVAPLMGPILGLALGLVRGDQRQTWQALVAEVGGVGAVVGTAWLVAVLVRPDTIDYGLREITARTQPTLYDLAIGLAAGLAGAYCLVHPRLEAGIAGVAIAVALVPPLSVTGLTLAGAHFGQLTWEPAFGSFMLFLANFLAIEMAAALVFVLSGLGEWRSLEHRGVRFQLLIKLSLLAATGAFLSHQLNQLLGQRRELTVVRQVLEERLSGIPGAWLQEVAFVPGSGSTEVVAEVASRQEIVPAQVQGMEVALQRAVAGRALHLVLRVVKSEYVSATGLLYEPKPAPDPEAARLQEVGTALRHALAEFPGLQLMDFRTDGSWLEAIVRSPYPVAPDIVATLQQKLRSALGRPELQLRVTSSLAWVATAERMVEYTRPGQEREQELETRMGAADRALRVWASRHGYVEQVRIEPPAVPAGAFSVTCGLVGATVVSEAEVQVWQGRLERLLAPSSEEPVVVQLRVSFRLGRELLAQPSPSPTPSPP